MAGNDAPGDDELSRKYAQPFGWWGLERDERDPRTLAWLIDAGTLSVGEAALLTLAIEMRRTVIVAAEEAQAGKTTLLTALLRFMDPDTTPIYIRGIYERFEYQSRLDPAGRYVLCNEISHHLPTYLWGRGVRHLFDGLAAGFPMATTMHAASGEDAIAALLDYPLDVPAEHVTSVDLVATMRRAIIDGREVRRLKSIDRVVSRRDAPTAISLSVRDPFRSAPQLFSGRMITALSTWGELSAEEATRLLATQERFLRAAARDTADAPDVFERRVRGFQSR